MGLEMFWLCIIVPAHTQQLKTITTGRRSRFVSFPPRGKIVYEKFLPYYHCLPGFSVLPCASKLLFRTLSYTVENGKAGTWLWPFKLWRRAVEKTQFIHYFSVEKYNYVVSLLHIISQDPRSSRSSVGFCWLLDRNKTPKVKQERWKSVVHSCVYEFAVGISSSPKWKLRWS